MVRLMRRLAPFFMVHRRDHWTLLKLRHATDKSGPSVEDLRQKKMEANFKTTQRHSERINDRRSKPGHTALWQARLIMLVMINIAQLWILAATVEAALARHYSVLLPLVISSGVCFAITLSIIKWWGPVSGRKTSSGYVRDHKQ